MDTQSNDSGNDCPGQGKCHGCVKWCDACGDVEHVCDTRIAMERCDAHPIPPEQGTISARRKAAEQKLYEAQVMEREARTELAKVYELQTARNEYAEQVHAHEKRMFGIK